jgi:hypothetical protein
MKKPALPCGNAGLIMENNVGGTPTLLELFRDERGDDLVRRGLGGLLLAEPGAA